YPRPRPSSLPDVAPATLLGADLRDRCQTNQHTTADISRPTSAAAVVGIGRNPPLKPTVQFELAVQISSPFLHQIDRASEVQPTSRRNLRRVEAVEVRGIHHRATHSFRASKPELKLVTGNILAVGRKYLRLFDRGDSAEFSAEV
ncbi:hypothetical protein Prudu_012870, partial [Prunus dulcis]